jgi:putative ubiquitin-RnfH superfamily antitoxin RatB of RatAB toxin-antitoxin module
MADPTIAVAVVKAGAHRRWRLSFSLPAGSTAMQAVESTRWLAGLSAEVSEPLRLGIHSRRVEADHVLRDGDRVEIYRPLALDPMAARRRRAGKG